MSVESISFKSFIKARFSDQHIGISDFILNIARVSNIDDYVLTEVNTDAHLGSDRWVWSAAEKDRQVEYIGKLMQECHGRPEADFQTLAQVFLFFCTGVPTESGLTPDYATVYFENVRKFGGRIVHYPRKKLETVFLAPGMALCLELDGNQNRREHKLVTTNPLGVLIFPDGESFRDFLHGVAKLEKEYNAAIGDPCSSSGKHYWGVSS